MNERVVEILKERRHGVEAETAGLQELADGLAQLLERAESNAEALLLANCYTVTASRLAGLLRVRRELAAAGEAAGQGLLTPDLIAALSESGLTFDLPRVEPSTPQEWRDRAGGLKVEIATLRWVLENTLELGRQALKAAPAKEYARLVDSYGIACRRLVKLLGDEQIQAQETNRAAINQALDEIAVELDEMDRLREAGVSPDEDVWPFNQWNKRR